VIIERRQNDTHMLTPWVHKSFGAIRDPLTWIADVRAPDIMRSPQRQTIETGNRGEDDFTTISK
jgi:hypothetical protein